MSFLSYFTISFSCSIYLLFFRFTTINSTVLSFTQKSECRIIYALIDVIKRGYDMSSISNFDSQVFINDDTQRKLQQWIEGVMCICVYDEARVEFITLMKRFHPRWFKAANLIRYVTTDGFPSFIILFLHFSDYSVSFSHCLSLLCSVKLYNVCTHIP